MEALFAVEGLCLAHGIMHKLPLGPWTMESVLERGPLYLQGECCVVDIPFRELALGLSDATQIVRMNLKEQYLTLLELQVIMVIADSDPLELGRARLSQLEGVFPFTTTTNRASSAGSVPGKGLLDAVPYKPRPSTSRL